MLNLHVLACIALNADRYAEVVKMVFEFLHQVLNTYFLLWFSLVLFLVFHTNLSTSSSVFCSIEKKCCSESDP